MNKEYPKDYKGPKISLIIPTPILVFIQEKRFEKKIILNIDSR
jgi:hypothetical protein